MKWKKEKREGEEEKRELRKGQSHGEKRRRKEDSLWKIVKKKSGERSAKSQKLWRIHGWSRERRLRKGKKDGEKS